MSYWALKEETVEFVKNNFPNDYKKILILANVEFNINDEDRFIYRARSVRQITKDLRLSRSEDAILVKGEFPDLNEIHFVPISRFIGFMSQFSSFFEKYSFELLMSGITLIAVITIIVGET